ncbi:response regulator transcription factor [Candidatus Contubernalis alkaliaceticus]|uniref:response regulator transcription factor n=1 Tax=Candidatus Contubernalis alkaliaceticus TaxID=338645 RepID=UPI001F4BE9E8|nr:response regulator transcription factor [Candidatus Contubernalis alkalaceticus]UNC92035.1 response regulator transcription factor [Candidatus Contubernalis alkalaceticus]
MYRVALIEDDIQLRELISGMLKRYGYEVLAIDDFKHIMEYLKQENPDIILLDINLPYFDGFEICKAIRRKSNVPIIIISARNSEAEQVMGIEFGADDYVTKPFSMEVLRAKITACIRRVYGKYIYEKNMLEYGYFMLDYNTFSVSYRKKCVDLTKNEFRILKRLAEKSKTIVEREELLRELWDDIDFVDNNTLNVNVSRIKAKLKEIGIGEAIVAKRGQGYIFTPYWLEEHNE